MGSRPATSTLPLPRAASTSACIAPQMVEKRAKRTVPWGDARGTGKDLGWLLDLRVDPLPGVALLHVELAEARDLDLLAVLEAVRHDFGERVEEPLGIALRGVRLAGDLLYQGRLV